MPTHDRRPPADPADPAGPAPRTAQDAPCGPDGRSLGVEPIARRAPADPAEDRTAHRARLLAANAWRSVPPAVG